MGVSFWVGSGFQNGGLFIDQMSPFFAEMLGNGMTSGGLTALVLSVWTCPWRRDRFGTVPAGLVRCQQNAAVKMRSFGMEKIGNCAAATLLAVATAIGAPAAEAQQVLEIDTVAGRVIIDDIWRAIGTFDDIVLDRNRAILYVSDAEEPEGVMAFSLETGEWIRTISTPTGDGPHEVSEGLTGMSIARDGGLYVSGHLRILKFDALGTFVSYWQPRAEPHRKVCGFGGQPAIPVRGGVIRRGPDGTDEGVGPGQVDGRGADRMIVKREMVEGNRTVRTGWTAVAQIACTDDEAYVVLSYEEGPDSVFVYHRDGEMQSLAVPTDFAEVRDGCTVKVTMPSARSLDWPCSGWNRQLKPSLDDLGNLVLLGRNVEVSGTVVDPETGCYAVVRKPGPSLAYDAGHIYQDSALVFGYDSGSTDQGGSFISQAANRVSLHPLRRVSGVPCPGMLPSVDGVSPLGPGAHERLPDRAQW